MRLILLSFFIMLIQHTSDAHPSWGIVMDAKGNIYFADVLHDGQGAIWKMDTHGKITKFLTDFHAHDIQMDSSGNLWVAENRWIQGVIEGEGMNTLLRITPGEKIDTLIHTGDSDEFFGGSFALSGSNGVYFSRNNKIYLKSFKGGTKKAFDHIFKRIVTLYSSTNNTLWITDSKHKNGTLFRWDPQKGLSEYATGLLPENPKNPVFSEQNHQLLYGVHEQSNGNIYVADNVSRTIQKITRDGTRSVFYTSDPPWHPLGVVFWNDDAYVLEAGFDRTNIGPRIIHLSSEGSKTVLFEHGVTAVVNPKTENMKNQITPAIYWFLTILMLVFLLVYIIRKTASYAKKRRLHP